MKRALEIAADRKTRKVSELGEVLMPTPAAVLAAGTLLSEGSATQKGLGKLMLVDVGGATVFVLGVERFEKL